MNVLAAYQLFIDTRICLEREYQPLPFPKPDLNRTSLKLKSVYPLHSAKSSTYNLGNLYLT